MANCDQLIQYIDEVHFTCITTLIIKNMIMLTLDTLSKKKKNRSGHHNYNKWKIRQYRYFVSQLTGKCYIEQHSFTPNLTSYLITSEQIILFLADFM